MIKTSVKKYLQVFCGLTMLLPSVAMAQEQKEWKGFSISDADELMEQVRNMPFVEVGKGVSFTPKNKLFKMTIRFRMQNQLAMDFDDDFSLEETQAQVKRLRLRLDGFLYSPKLLYCIQLGFTPYDTKVLPNGNNNFIRDAVVCYRPSDAWNIAFGQTTVKSSRENIKSSSAMQFSNASIVNSEFNPDRDFGFFGEYYKRLFGNFNVTANAAVTLGEGRNWVASKSKGFAYTGRVELFPLGRFKASGEVIEGDFLREQSVKLMLAGAFSYNDRTTRVHGQCGSQLPDGVMASMKQYYLDFVLKYRGFAFCADFMGRICDKPLYSGDLFTYAGKGVNAQTSYIFRKNWEVALRNSTLLPDAKVRPMVGYTGFNQTTFAVTKYLIGHSLKVQADASYNHRTEALNAYNRWQLRFVLEAGL